MIQFESIHVSGWEAAKGFEGYYLISPNGEVYSVRGRRLLKPFVNQKCGYAQVELNLNGAAAKHLIHRMVAEAYIPNPDSLPCVNHKDGNKRNNCAENLEWVSYGDNMKHASEHGLLKTKGENNPASKLTEEDVRYIKAACKRGDREFGTAALGRKFGVDHKAISSIINGKTWREVQ